MAAGLADLLALDVTTSEFAVAVRDDQGNEDYASMPKRRGFPGVRSERSARDAPRFAGHVAGPRLAV